MPVIPREPVSVAGVLVAEPVDLFPVLAAAFGVVLDAMALVSGGRYSVTVGWLESGRS